MKTFYARYARFAASSKHLALLGLRLLLAYVFLYPALSKWQNMEGTIYWFESLGIPLPALNAYLSASIEIIGVGLLILGLFARFITPALITTMLVAIKTVHLGNGWFTIGQSALNSEIDKRISAAKSILREHGNYEWLTEEGGFVILQNGLENPVTYIFMLSAIFAFGPGKFSLDHFLFERKINI